MVWTSALVAYLGGTTLGALLVVVLSRLTTYDPIYSNLVRSRTGADIVALIHYVFVIVVWSMAIENARRRSRNVSAVIAACAGMLTVALVLLAVGLLPVVQHDAFMHSEVAWPLLLLTSASSLSVVAIMRSARTPVHVEAKSALVVAVSSCAVALVLYVAKTLLGVFPDFFRLTTIALACFVPAYCCAIGLFSTRESTTAALRLVCGLGLIFFAAVTAVGP